MILGYILVAILAWALVSFFYDAGVLPCLRDRAKFELFRLRDELRDLAINCQVEPDSFAFQHLETMLNRMTRLCVRYSVSDMFYVTCAVKIDPESLDEVRRFDAEASGQLKFIERRAIESMVRIMFVNSPVFVIFAGAIILTSEACKRSIEFKNRVFWHDNPAISSACMSGSPT